MQFLSGFAGALKFGLFNMAWIFIVLWGVERLWPRGQNASNVERLRALRYWAFYISAGAFFATLFGQLHAKPLFKIPLTEWVKTAPWAGYVLGPLLFLAFYDFFNYWMHRAQHKWFWKQHTVHHSIEHISGLNSYFHWTEELFRIACIVAPMTLVLGMSEGGATIVSTLFMVIHGNYIHSPTAIHFGPVGAVVVDNRWHRIHHSVERRHWDKNFGTGVTIWDHLFGTAYAPGKEWPEVGVHDQPEYVRLRDYLWPWRQDRGKAVVGTVNPPSEA